MDVSKLSTAETQSIFQRHLAQRQQLTDVSLRIAASAGLSEILPHILSGICEATQAVCARIVLEGNGGFNTHAAGTYNDDFVEMDEHIYRYSQQNPATGVTPLTTIPLEMKNLNDNPIKALIILPLYAQESWQGVLWIGFDEHYNMPEDELEFVNLLTLQAAIAIANARAFEAARSGREQLAAILASAIDAIIMVDNKYRIQVFNPAAESLFGISAQNAIGSTFDRVITSEVLLGLLYPERVPANSQDDDDKPKTIEYVAKDGRTFSPHISLVIGENEDVSGYLLALRDVSHFKRLVENMSEFLHTVSHDLRSPLTAAKGNLDMFALVGELNEKQEGMKQKVLTSIADMTNLIEKVLDAGRLDPEMGTYQLRRETCDPTAIVNKIVSTLSNAAAQQSITMKANVAPNIPIMSLDEMMLERALTNLAENAIKYSPEGTTVVISANLENNHLVFSVSDNGYGIAEEDQAVLFERGKRIRRREHRAVRGSGLGLFIVKNVAEQHGGKASLQSRLGEGSTFSISIPLTSTNLVGGSTN